MLNDKGYLFEKEKNQFNNFQFLSSWKNHYKSWVETKEFPIFCVKYEDLEKKPLDVIEGVINFIIKVGKLNTSFDIVKAKKCIETCSFENLKKKEENEGFKESVVGQKSGKKLTFFNLGRENNWRKLLPNNIKEQMNKIFKKDLDKWGYETDD
jgi:hypothetical protein